MESWIAGALDRMRETQHEHGAILREIRAELQRLQLKPPPDKPLDFQRYVPFIWRLGLAGAVLLGFRNLPPEDAMKILLALF